MASIDEHRRTIQQMEDDILQKIREKTVLERQKIIGFASSEGAVNCFALLLHKNNLIPAGFNVNHKWFASIKLANEKFPFDIPKKSETISKLVKIENLRDKLCYGKEKPLKEVEETIKLFFELKENIFIQLGENL